jgi:hypothetical protein
VQPSLTFQAPNDFFTFTTEELLSLAAQRTTSKEEVGPLPVLGGREMVPDSSTVTPSSITVQGAMKDVKGTKKSRKRHC